MKLYSLDIETTGLDSFTDKILLIGVFSPESGYYGFRTVSEFMEFHNKERPQYILHNGAFDLNFLRRNGIDVFDSFSYDTRSISSILTPTPSLSEGQKHVLGLENLNKVLLGGRSYKLDRERMSEYSIHELTEYNKQDCIITYNLFKYLLNKLPDRSWEFVESWLMPTTRICANLEYNGIYGDWDGLKKYQNEIELIRNRVLDELNELTINPRKHWKEKQENELKQIYETKKNIALSKAKNPSKRAKFYDDLFEKARQKIEEFNWSSPSQLAWLLGEYYNLDLLNHRTQKETTDDEKLKELDHPVAKKLIEYREVDKLLTQQIPGLLDNVKQDFCVHSRFSVGGTRTGRLSSSQPNLQQISSRKEMGRKIRSYIRAREGKALATIDFAQLEPRILAHYSKEPALLNAFKDGVDIYSVFAKEIFGLDKVDLKTFKQTHPLERACGKTGGLSVIYGTGGRKFAEMVRKETGTHLSENKAIELVKGFRERLPKVKEFKDKLEIALRNQKVYYNLLGRPFIIESNDDLYMKALNTLIQGSSSDLVIYSQFALVFPALEKHRIPYTHRLLVHDETVIELPESEAKSIVKELIEPLMTNGVEETLNLDVPLKVEYTVGKAWEKA